MRRRVYCYRTLPTTAPSLIHCAGRSGQQCERIIKNGQGHEGSLSHRFILIMSIVHQVRHTNEKEPVGDAASTEVIEPAKVSFFRSTLWNTLVVGWASFLAPGIYNALASTGAGGLADVSIKSQNPDRLTTDQYRQCLHCHCLWSNRAIRAHGHSCKSSRPGRGRCLSNQVILKLGPRVTLIIGSCGYAPFAASLASSSNLLGVTDLICSTQTVLSGTNGSLSSEPSFAERHPVCSGFQRDQS
jgi:hypothetical protein